jgi:hypothetical protein
VAAVALPRLRGRVRRGQERAHETAWGRACSAQGGASRQVAVILIGFVLCVTLLHSDTT